MDEIRTHNKLHQVVKAGDVALAYDKSGNMTDDGSRTFEYDAFNRIRTVKRKADSLTIGEYCYDAHGRRIRKTVSNGGLSGDIANGTTDCLYAGNQCVEERQQIGQVDTPIRQFIWGLYIDELIQLREDVSGAPADYYPLQDLLYRTTALTDSAGDIVETYDTDAYGRTLAFSSPGPDGHWFTDDDVTTSQPRCEYIYTGRQYDPESQLYYYRARYYSPTLGRFMQRDPLGQSASVGLYQIVDSRSVGFVDPFGLLPVDMESSNMIGLFGGDLNPCAAQYLHRDREEHAEPSGDPGPLVLEDLGPVAALAHWAGGSGRSIVIVGQDFIDHVRGIPTVQFHIENLETSMRSDMRTKARSVECDGLVRSTRQRKDEAFTMTGWRWAAFGTAYHDYAATCTGRKKCLSERLYGNCEIVEYSCVYNVNGHDFYHSHVDLQRSMGGVGRYTLYPLVALTAWIISPNMNMPHRDYNISWSYQEFTSGRLGVQRLLPEERRL